jgi:hypothetical protein
MSIAAMKQALEALDCINPPLNVRGMRKLGEAMRTLRQAIAEAMQQEPVAECTYPQCQATNGCVGACSKTAPVHASDMSEKNVRVSDKNQHEFFCPRCGHCCKDWVSLTDEEIKALSSWWPSYDQMPALMTLARDIENSLKEKNT